MQTCNQGQQVIAAMSNPLRFPGGQPTALLFVESAQQQVQLVMQLLVRMGCRLKAIRTLAWVNGCEQHFLTPADKVLAADCSQEKVK
jgi:hypothetical protein